MISPNPHNFLPGPVYIEPEIQKSFEAPCISHRGDTCLTLMQQIQKNLCHITGAPNAQIILGSGTLANEMVAAQLSLLQTKGLILSNGEFGERLIKNARCAQLQFSSLQYPWGESFDLDALEKAISQLPSGSWVWAVHHETSTGILNPIDTLKALCQRQGIHLCLDCISSVGAMPVDLKGIYLATAVSGKGLGSLPGLSIVFHSYLPTPQPERLAGYMDLGNWAANQSIPYTHSSNLLNALATATRLATPKRMAQISAHMLWLRETLTQYGFTLLIPLVSAHTASPAIVTIVLNNSCCTTQLGNELERLGYWLSFRSAYLRERNWIQIALLGNPAKESLESLVNTMRMAYNATNGKS